MQNAILYQAYGGPDAVNECRYSLLKYLQVYNFTPPSNTIIIVYTDAPESFSDFQPFLAINTPTLKDIVYRGKVEILMNFIQGFEGNVLFLENDTYLTSRPDTLFKDLNNGDHYLYGLNEKINQVAQKWRQFLSAIPATLNQKQLQADKELKMYNANIVGLNSRNKNLLHDLQALTVAAQPRFQKTLSEQFAFSYCLQKGGTVKTADHLLAHYDDLKEFRPLLKNFFTINAEESIPNLVKKLNHLDALAIQREKHAYKKLPALHRFYKNITGRGWKIARYEKWL